MASTVPVTANSEVAEFVWVSGNDGPTPRWGFSGAWEDLGGLPGDDEIRWPFPLAAIPVRTFWKWF
jgi:hypothetical protein